MALSSTDWFSLYADSVLPLCSSCLFYFSRLSRNYSIFCCPLTAVNRLYVMRMMSVRS